MSEHTHAEHECWVPVFVDWAEGRTDTLDFGGRKAPERLQQLLTALEPSEHVLTMTEDGWNIQHPLACRPNLGDCEVNLTGHQIGDLRWAHGNGKFRLDERGWQPL